AITAGTVAFLAIGAFFYSHRAQALTDKDTIVVADFSNTTGDPVFDDTLKQGISVQLSQSPFLNLLSDNRVSETLKMMGRPPEQRLTKEVAQEICVRSNSKAVLSGSITKLGTHYAIGLKAISCKTQESLGNTQGEAESQEKVLHVLSGLATSMRGK